MNKKIFIFIFTAIVTTVISAILYYPISNFLYSKDPRIVIQGQYFEWESPVQKEWLEKICEVRLAPIILGLSRLEYINKEEEEKEVDFGCINSFWRITVKNKREKEAEDLILSIPSSGWYNISSENQVKSFIKEIKLGNLKQGDNLIVKLWLTEEISPILIDNATIKSKNAGIHNIIVKSNYNKIINYFFFMSGLIITTVLCFIYFDPLYTYLKKKLTMYRRM